MVRNGNRLVFDQDAGGKDVSYIENKRTDDKIWLRQENGIYVLDLLVGPPKVSTRKMSPRMSRLFTGDVDSVDARICKP